MDKVAQLFVLHLAVVALEDVRVVDGQEVCARVAEDHVDLLADDLGLAVVLHEELSLQGLVFVMLLLDSFVFRIREEKALVDLVFRRA